MLYQATWWTFGQLVRGAFRARIQGREHIPQQGPAILASNHVSFVDHLILPMATRRQVFFISKVEHFESRFKRFFFRRWGVIPLKRGAGDKDAFERSMEVLRAGGLFAIYPEGTRSRDGKLHKGHTGVARLHLLSGAPIVPVAMVGTYRALPKGKTWPKFVKCEARIGPPLTFHHLASKVEDRATLKMITRSVMDAIQELGGQEYVDEYQYNPEVKGHAAGGNGVKDGERSATTKH